MSLPEFSRIAPDVKLGKNVQLYAFVNLYGCTIGDETKIGAFVEIQKNAAVGPRCKISSHSFLCEGVVLEAEVFVGHGVMFINDRYPRATAGGRLQTESDWAVTPTRSASSSSASRARSFEPAIASSATFTRPRTQPRRHS